MKIILLFLFSISISNQSNAQHIFSGIVIDSLTNKPMPFVKVFYKNTTDGVITDFNGEFTAKTLKQSDSIQFSYVGYETVSLSTQIKGELSIKLNSSTQLDIVEVIAQGINPAFKILREVNINRIINDPRYLTAYESEIYNKIQIDLTNLDSNFEDSKLIRNFDFIGNYADTLNGKKYLPILLSESISNYYFKRNSNQKKEIIKASKRSGLNDLDITEYTGDMHQNVNVYDHFIRIFNKDFVSPIAHTGRTIYKYYYTGKDTIDNQECYHIIYRSRRKGEAAFIGDIWITTDNYAVKKVIAEIPNYVNLNYVSFFKVEQNYTRIDSTIWMIKNEKVFAEFNYFNDAKKKKLAGFNIKRTTQRKNFIINQPKPDKFYLENVVVSDKFNEKNQAYWESNRQSSLSNEEIGILKMTDSLNSNRTFRFYNDFAYLNLTGFWKFNRIEVGNVFSAYSKNKVEGQRFRLSLRTSNNFSKTHEITVFGIYGLKDQEFKYGASYRIKLKKKPREILRFAYHKKIEQLGISQNLNNKSSSFTSLFSIGSLDKLTMVDKASISFEKDYIINLRTYNALEWKNYIPLGTSNYNYTNTEGDTVRINRITSFEITTQVMYTKEERFISANFDRVSGGSLFPIFSLTHTLGLSNVLTSQYDFNRFDIYMDHNARIGLWGRLRYKLYAGKIYGTLPYPFLNIHAGNQSYFLQREAFNLMNYFEFVSDSWIGLNFEHRLQGLLLDRIPLIRKLKLRTVYSFKSVIGSFNDKHLKTTNLPKNTKQLSFTKPYIEMNVGIENIFKYIRIDAIWRLTYLNSEESSKFGVKFMFTGNF